MNWDERYDQRGKKTEPFPSSLEIWSENKELKARIKKLEAVVERAQALVRSEHSPMLTEVRLGRRQFAKLVSALAALEQP